MLFSTLPFLWSSVCKYSQELLTDLSKIALWLKLHSYYDSYYYRECSEPHLFKEIGFPPSILEEKLKLYKDFMMDINSPLISWRESGSGFKEELPDKKF